MTIRNILVKHELWLKDLRTGKRANFSYTDLRGADFTDAVLNDANFCGANLRNADLRGAGLSGADLRGADLREADFTGANLYGADFTGADLRGVDFQGANLRNAKGLPVAPIIDTDKEWKIQYIYSIDIQENGEFCAEVRNPNGGVIFHMLNETLILSGDMKHVSDLAGLAKHLKQTGVIRWEDSLTTDLMPSVLKA